MLAEDGLLDACVEAILQRMCSHPRRVPDQSPSSDQLGRAIAALACWKKKMKKRAAKKAAGGWVTRPNSPPVMAGHLQLTGTFRRMPSRRSRSGDTDPRIFLSHSTSRLGPSNARSPYCISP